MAKNTAPSSEEVDRMVELYDELGSKKAVAEHEEIDYSRTTVNKWINRRLEEEEPDEEEGDDLDADPFTAGPDDEPPADLDGDFTVEENGAEPVEDDDAGEDFSDILVDEPPTPNEILVGVLEADPTIKEKHRKYVESKFSQTGQMSPSDVGDTLSDIKINNKRQTIARVKNNYTTQANTVMRDYEDISQYDEWGTYLTKVTGDPRYAQDEPAEGAVGGDAGVQAPPVAGQQGNQQGGAGVHAPQPSGPQPQTGHPQPGQPGQQQNNGYGAGGQPARAGAAPAAAAPAPQQDEGLSEFEERLLNLVEDQMDDDDGQQETQPEPAADASSPTDQIEELLQLQSKVEQLTGGDGSNEANAQLEATLNQLNERINQLAEQVNDDTPRAAPRQTNQSSGGEMGMVEKIAVLSEKVDDPDIIQTVMEMETDPEVLKAKNEREEIENESAWKKEIASALTPAATEKLVEAGLNFTQTVTSAGQQQAAAQQAQQAQQGQPQPAVVEEEQQQPRRVERAQPEQQQQAPNPQPESNGSSPMREEGLNEMEEEAETAEAEEEEPAQTEAEADDGESEEQ